MRDRSEYPAAVGDDPRAAIILDFPAQRVAAELGGERREVAGIRCDRLERRGLPHLCRLRLAEQPPAAGQRAVPKLDLEPLRKIPGAERESARRHRRTAEFLALVEHRIGAVAPQHAADPGVRKGAVRRGPARLIGGGGVLHAAAPEHFLGHELLPGLAADFLDQLARDGVENVVIGIARAETGRRLDVREALDGFLARQAAARDEQQIPCPQPEPAAVDQQIADRHLAGDPRIVHTEPRDVVDHLVVPAELALIDEDGDRRRGERLAGRAGLEDRVGVDLGGLAELADAPALGERGLAMLDDRDGDAGRAGLLAQRLDLGIEARGRIRQSGNGEREQRQREQMAQDHAAISMEMAERRRISRASPIVISGSTNTARKR